MKWHNYTKEDLLMQRASMFMIQANSHEGTAKQWDMCEKTLGRIDKELEKRK